MDKKKTFGFIGAGSAAQAVAKHLSKNGYGVTLSNSRDAASLEDVVAELGNGVKAATAAEAAEADIVVLAVPWKSLSGLPAITDWRGKKVIDLINHFVTYQPNFQLADLGDKTASEIVQTYVEGAKVVKAFNTLYSKILENDPHEGNGRRVLFVSGDDMDFKSEVMDIIGSLGFSPVDLGSLVIGGRLQQAKGALNRINLIQL